MTRRSALLAVAVTMLAVGIGIGARDVSAQGVVQARPGGPYSAFVGSAIQFDGTASTGIGLSYFWSFGDGTSAVGGRPVKAYGAPGAYTVTLTVTDSVGNRSVATTTATIFTPRPVIPSGCFVTVSGIVCPQVVFPGFLHGCVLTAVGWVCPRFVVPVPLIIPGIGVVSCANPNYAYTPFCRGI